MAAAGDTGVTAGRGCIVAVAGGGTGKRHVLTGRRWLGLGNMDIQYSCSADRECDFWKPVGSFC